MSNSGNSIQDTLSQLDNWAQRYEDAVESGVFGNPTPQQVTSPMFSDPESFFGPQNNIHTSTPSPADAQYWNAVNAMGDGYTGDPMTLISEQSKKELGDSAKSVASTPNPIRHGTVGMDQDSEVSMGDTWTVEELEDLAEMKIKLHELGDKLAAFESGKKVDTDINNLKKRIDELSDSLCNHTAITQQGD